MYFKGWDIFSTDPNKSVYISGVTDTISVTIFKDSDLV